MKKTTLIQCPLMFCLATALGFSTLTAAENMTAEHEKMQNDYYATQDRYASKSEALAAAGKFDQAIEILDNRVVKELQDELKRSDSWRAKRRLAEYSAKLRALRLKYGTIKLRSAEKAYAEGRYADAMKFALEAKGVCDELTAESDEIAAAARSRQTANEYRDKTNPEKIDAKLVEKEKQVKAALAAARTLIKHGRYEAASAEIEKVYVIDPFNAEAGQLANTLYKAYYTTGVKRRDADVAGQLAYEAWQWVEPQFPREIDNVKKVDAMTKSADDTGLQAKLDRIIFPKVQFAEADLNGVADFMTKRSKNYSPDNQGVMVQYVPPSLQNANAGSADGETDPEAEQTASRRKNSGDQADVAQKSETQITLELKNVSMRDLINYVCYLADISYEIRDDRVVLGTIGKPVSKDYAVSSTLQPLINAFFKGTDPDASSEKSEDGEEADSKAKSADELQDGQLKNFFKMYGVEFPEEISASIELDGNVLTMRNTAANHQRLEALLRELNEDKPMVQIEVKSIELNENDMEELGFNWALSELSNKKLDSKGYYTGSGIYTGDNTRYSDGSAKALSMLSNMLSGVDSRMISNLNIFPDLLGSFKPFGGNQEFSLSLTINALDRSDRTEMISAPKVLVSSGEEAEVKMGKGYFFPTDWDELEIEIEDSDGDNGYAYTLTLPTPSFNDEPDMMGTNFKVTPRVLADNRTIRLDIRPEIKSYTGKDEYFMDVLVYRDGKLSEEESRRNLAIWRPVISTRSIDVQVDVYHGETMVLGGLSDSISQSRLDKIPILGDIPFIGRLFQSHSEVSTRRNMLIFVTAKLMNSSGEPIRKLQNNFGIPEMGR